MLFWLFFLNIVLSGTHDHFFNTTQASLSVDPPAIVDNCDSCRQWCASGVMDKLPLPIAGNVMAD